LAGYANRKADALLEEARVSLSDEERATKYQEFQQILDADIPAVFLYQSSYTYARSTKVHGPTVSNLISPSDRFAYITQWYVKTKRVYK
jgi:ABC-type transport system substrate-binding protein